MKIRMKLTLMVGLIALALMVMPVFAADNNSGCVTDAKGPLVSNNDKAPAGKGTPAPRPMTVVQAQVGEIAPDFEATAFYQGGFKKVKLSDYRGKWVLLCFYPGDFTFV